MDTTKEREKHSPILFLSIHKDDPSESGAYISENATHNYLLNSAKKQVKTE